MWQLEIVSLRRSESLVYQGRRTEGLNVNSGSEMRDRVNNKKEVNEDMLKKGRPVEKGDS